MDKLLVKENEPKGNRRGSGNFIRLDEKPCHIRPWGEGKTRRGDSRSHKESGTVRSRVVSWDPVGDRGRAENERGPLSRAGVEEIMNKMISGAGWLNPSRGNGGLSSP